MPTQRFAVDRSAIGLRLDVYLTRSFHSTDEPERPFTRSEIQRLIGAGQVLVNGARAKASARLKPGDCVEVWVPAPRSSGLQPEALPLDILYEDDDLIVINKAPGMMVHPAAGRSQGTLVNALLHHCPAMQGIGGESRPGIVHRLDKDTSGVIVVAKTAVAFHSLAAQFKNRTAKKEYLALVWGALNAKKGMIDRPIGRHRSDRKRMSSLYFLKRARDAVTEWKLEEEFWLPDRANSRQCLSLLRLFPRTGRTHQLRVHLADLGYPLVGDRIYGRKRLRASPLSPRCCGAESFPRQALHAERLTIEHPRSRKTVGFYAPLPDDLRELFRSLRKARSNFDDFSTQGVDKKRAFT